MKVIKPLLPKYKWVFLLLFIRTSNVYSQISDGSLPASFISVTKSAELLPSHTLDSVRVEKMTREDRNQGIPNRYGVVEEINIDIREKGVKTVVDKVSIWRYEIRCPDSRSLAVSFSVFRVPDGAAVYVYSSDKKELRGGFTSLNNREGDQLTLSEIRGNSLIIEYNEPEGVSFPGELKVGYVIKAYSPLKSATSGRIGINCPAGDDWQVEKRAICLMTFYEYPYAYYCTGYLVNNVRKDQTPYFMTANHCISTNKVAGTMVTYFNYENSTCMEGDASLEQSLSGAELKATNNYSDFTLLKLTENPPAAYSPYFAGWNASKEDIPTKGTCIHHPQGSAKCIATDTDAPASFPYYIQWDDNLKTNPNTHWKVVYNSGNDESGSSGSPLFDQNKRVIGQLHGGNETSSYFGKFSVSWDYGYLASAQLKAWLDPDNTQTLKLDGIDFKNLPQADFTADVSRACLRTTVFLTDKSKLSSEWLWKIEPETYEFVDGTDAHSQNPEVKFLDEGNYSVTLVAGNLNGKDTITYENLVKAQAEFKVTFTDLPSQITLCGRELKDYRLVADGGNSYSFGISESDKVDVGINANELSLTLKDEVMKYGSFDMVAKVTGSHGCCISSDSVVFHVVIPPNDDMENALSLSLGRNSGFSNECATIEYNEPFPPATGCEVEGSWCPALENEVLDNSVWFTFQGTTSGKVTIDTRGFDSQIAVYEADSYSNLKSGKCTLLAAGDNSSSGTAASLRDVPVETGKTYWLQADGTNGAYGEMTIDLISNTIEVYPNPSTGIYHLTLSAVEEGTAETEVFSLEGKRIYSGSFPLDYENNNLTIDLSGQSPGIYLFRARINGLSMSRKLVLSR